MREDMDNRFDLLIRETMADAEVKVPSRVWKAVSRRIGTPSAGVATSLWKWMVPSLAAAAAVAVFIVSGLTEKTIMNEGRMALDVKPMTFAFESALSSADIRPLSLERRNFVPSQTPCVADELAPEQSDNTPQTSDNTTEFLVNVPSESVVETSQPAETEQQEAFDDPFARMEAEDAYIESSSSRKSGRTSLLVGGTLGVNDTHYDNTSFGPSFAPGSRVPSSVAETTMSEYGFPVTAGIGLRYRISDKLSVGSGVNWTLLSRTFDGGYKGESGRFTHKMQYIGIPLNLYFDIASKNMLKLYAYAGGRAEKAIYNGYFIYEKSADPICKEAVKGLQFGVDLGFGVEFKMGDLVSLYLDPCVQYWFAGTQPKSIRTEKPILFSFEAGLRFNL